MSTREQRAHAIVEQIDDATARLLSNQLKLVRLASNKDKSIATLAAETAEIESCSLGIERAVEDMLVVSRTLKEAWVLGQIKKPQSDITADELERREQLVKQLTKTLGSTMDYLTSTNTQL